ncbi:RCC1 domain-containing protein [Bdellovibrio sp. HCB-110]|uniref:RCC1 domain-containing protein n=1 Tax=Bdellovibrio sp. HCB-110 TaxID=3391182 RepID=UPI0039B3EA8D
MDAHLLALSSTTPGLISDNESFKALYLAYGVGSKNWSSEQQEGSYSASEKFLTRLENVQNYDSSNSFKCATVANGDAYCWGNNNVGQLGNGTTTASDLPVKVNSTKKFVQITLGHEHSCALDDQGDVYCWGRGVNNTLGNGLNVDQSSPVRVLLPSSAKLVEAGSFATCAIATDDKIYCWGQGFSGPAPQQLSTSEILTSLQGGTNDAWCGLKAAGEAFCWGNNTYGQLGVGDTTYRAGPTAVIGGLLFSEISSAGVNRFCGLTSDGNVYCWGERVMGNSVQPSPVLVKGSSTLAYLFDSMSINEVCGLNATSSARECIGTDDGSSTVSESDYVFIQADTYCGLTNDHFLICKGDIATSGSGLKYIGNVSLYSFLNDLEAEKVFVGEYDFCAQKKNDKRIYCWGDNGSGGLGLGDSLERLTPVLSAGGMEFKDITIGEEFICGINLSDEAYCSGSNWTGVLGNNTTTDSNVFVPVSGGLKFKSLSAAYAHVCGITLSGETYCWGQNQSGALGDGTTTDRLVPTAVSGGHTFKKLLASSYHSCGLKEDGSVYCWGYNQYGQLGIGTTVDSSTPVKVNTSVVFKDMTMGGDHACGLDSDGKAYCWGSNFRGQLGDGTNTDGLVPVAVQTSLRFDKISSFNVWYGTTCAIEKDQHQVYCWGASLNQSLYANSTSPVHLAELASASDLIVAPDSLLLKNSGEPFIKNFSMSGPLYFNASTVNLEVTVKNPYSKYCILENSVDANTCSWVEGVVPNTYNLQNNGFIKLTLFVRDSKGLIGKAESQLVFKY